MAPATNNKPCAQHTDTSSGQPGHTSRTVTQTLWAPRAGLCGLKDRTGPDRTAWTPGTERTARAPGTERGSGTDSLGSRDRAGSRADSVGSRNGAGSGADSLGSRDGAGSGADSLGSRNGAGSGEERTAWAPGMEWTALSPGMERTAWAVSYFVWLGGKVPYPTEKH